MQGERGTMKMILVCFQTARPKDRGSIDWIIQTGKILSGRFNDDKGVSLDLSGEADERLEEIMSILAMDEKQLEALHGPSITSTCRRIVATLYPPHRRTAEAYSSMSPVTCKAIRGNFFRLIFCHLFVFRLCASSTSGHR